jgi:phage protein U
MSLALLALGPYIFRIAPLTLQKIEREVTVSHPEIQRFGAAPARQFTSPGSGKMKIEGLYFDGEFGGHEDWLALAALARSGAVVDVIGWGSGAAFGSVIGAMVILTISDAHEMIGPDGIGRKTAFSIELGSAGGGASGGLF